MKFVCERCQTKYSIADEKVRGKVLKVRCKSCSNVITVREQGGTVTKADDGNDDFSTHDSGRTAITSAAELQRRHAEAMKAMEGAKGQAASGRPKTGPLAAIPAEALSAPGTPKAAPPTRTGGSEEPIWFLAVDGNQTGPFTPLQLVDKILVQPKGADVHVWNPTLGDWRPPASVPEVHAQLEKKRRPAAPPPPPATARRTAPPMPSGAPAPSVPAMPAVMAAPAAKAPVLPTGRASKPHEIVKPAELEELLLEPSSPTRFGGGMGPPAEHAAHAASASALAPSLGEAAANRHGSMETFGSPERPLASTESDALAALSFVPRLEPQPSAARVTNGSVAAFSDVADASRATGSEAFFAKVSPTPPHLTGGSELMQLGGRRHRNVKLGFGLAAVVLVVGSVVALAVLRQPVSTASAEKAKTPTTGTDFAVLAQKLAEEQAQAPASGPPPATTPSSSGEPSKVVIPGRTPPSARRPPSRLPAMPRGTLTGTTPPPLEMSGEANRGVGRTIDGEMRVPVLHSGGGPKSTPSQADITRVINNNRSGIQTCYQRALMRDNTLKHGKVNIGITVGISGKVKKVTMDASPQFRSLEPCIREVVQRWAFPSSSEEYDTEFPVVLQGNE